MGLVAIKVLTPGYFASQDIRTPVLIAVVVLVVTQVLNLVLVPLLAHAGLALSIGVGAMVNALWSAGGAGAPRHLRAVPGLGPLCAAGGGGQRAAGGVFDVGAARRCRGWP